MDLDQYKTLTGLTVPTSKETLVTSNIRKSQRILEDMLGFTLDPTLFDDNKYTESGKTQTDCPCPDDDLTLDAPDAVVFAYRLFPYNNKDRYLLIDPATTIHKVKLVKDSVTYKTFETEDFRGEVKNGLIKYLELCETDCCCLSSCLNVCTCHQLAVDAVWVWADGAIPEDLQDVWAEMVTYYSDQKTNIKSETLGSHTYSKFKDTPPQFLESNVKVIKKYAGALGSVKRSPTV